MSRIFKIFFWGMFISFLGSLPLGTVNVTATNITVNENVYAGVLFSLGCLCIETGCLCFVLVAMDWICKRQKIFRLFEWLTMILILVMAAGSFLAAYKMKAFGASVFTAYHLPPFLFGLLLSSLNPLHIPFWIGWTTILINKKILIPGKKNYVIYATGISIGTMMGFLVFVYGGEYIIQQAGQRQNIVNWIVGTILLITALVQLYKIMGKKLPLKTQII
ncbi:lysine transporter LysE [Panacibacter ginsenosidivorans]|uniref:Lysine transporter LysE n=1 Tax=Panacibacter ginsenosidivorans TaxID=1813871 RepID=A0A5B8VGC1_9BACT|nr:LysE family transporter [Panacibacter ginsenosidivorans]QEC70062.1 lysine transporter LysE [Panacibacter ginsenosidivorans]